MLDFTPDSFLCVPRSQVFPPGCIPLILSGTLVFQSASLKTHFLGRVRHRPFPPTLGLEP